MITFKKQLGWSRWVTPSGLRKKPIHRWCVFPHSFTSELVHSLIESWNLNNNDNILDPFAGAGTTVLAAKEKGISSIGYDLSPFAVHAAKTKILNYDFYKLEKNWYQLIRSFYPLQNNGISYNYSDLVKKALPGKLLGAFVKIKNKIAELDCSKREKDFFLLALIETLPVYSRAIATGGWLSWINNKKNVRSIINSFSEKVDIMLNDVQHSTLQISGKWNIRKADARNLPDNDNTYSAVITSPPYPNRHDYTRVFGVELMFGYLNWEKTRDLRYQSFESHPEAHPKRPKAENYLQPKLLNKLIEKIKKIDKDERIKKLLEGYFLDMYLCLKEVKRVCKLNAKIAIVIGNAQYFGYPVFVDELTAEIGEQVGLSCKKIYIARYRGNSAQQMALFGKHPARESIVEFHNS